MASIKSRISSKVIALLIGGAVIGIAVSVWYVKTHRTYYIGNADRSIAFKVADEIVAAKDCVKYRAFVGSLVRPMFVPNRDCPWENVGEVGRFNIDGTEFTIPRQYLFYEKKVPDGDVDDLNLILRYPQMTPSNSQERQLQSIMVSIHSTTNSACREEHNCAEVANNIYRFEHDLRTGDSPTKNADPLVVRHLADDVVQYDRGVRNEYYIIGDVDDPSYWLKCTPPPTNPQAKRNPGCTSAFNWNDAVYVTYSFRRNELLERQLDVRRKIEDKLREFAAK